MIMKTRKAKERVIAEGEMPQGIIALDRLPPQPDPRFVAFVWSAPGEELPEPAKDSEA